MDELHTSRGVRCTAVIGKSYRAPSRKGRRGGGSSGDLRGLEVDRLLQEVRPRLILLQDDLDRGVAEAVGDGEEDVAHLCAELVAVDGAAAVEVELVEDGVVEGRELGRRSDDVDAEVGLEEAEGLEGAAELGAGEDAVAVEIQRRESLVDAPVEGRLVADEGSHRRSV